MSSPIQSYPLTNEVATVILNGSGNGTARWSPGAAGAPGSGVGAPRRGGYSTDVDGVAVNVAPAPGNPSIINEAQCSVYLSRGVQSATPSDFQGQTPSGSHGDTCTLGQRLVPQDWITAVWTGGDAGALATLTIIGTANPPGSGA
jgi:hypothetical protein